MRLKFQFTQEQIWSMLMPCNQVTERFLIEIEFFCPTISFIELPSEIRQIPPQDPAKCTLNRTEFRSPPSLRRFRVTLPKIFSFAARTYAIQCSTKITTGRQRFCFLGSPV